MSAVGVWGPGRRLATSKTQEKQNRLIAILGTGQEDYGSLGKGGGKL